jgi:HAD superfamily hydrolase (TIGR01509 family)
MTLKALLWDVDGTIAETERDGHRVAFNLAFEACGLPWHWSVERYGQLLAVMGGRERLMHEMTTREDAPSLPHERDSLARKVHQRKNALYAEIVHAHGISLRPGVQELMSQCRLRGIRMAITTTTSKDNVAALLAAHLGAGWAGWFDVLVCGEDVARKKPDPEVYAQALRRLSLDPLDTMALEDSPSGVASACAAHVPVVVTRSTYFANATFEGAIAIGPGLDQRALWRPELPASHASIAIGLDDLMAWHERTARTSQFG